MSYQADVSILANCNGVAQVTSGELSSSEARLDWERESGAHKWLAGFPGP